MNFGFWRSTGVFLILPAGLILGTLAGCQQGNEVRVSPQEVAVQPDRVAVDAQTYQGRQVAWGGSIVAVKNLKDRTEIEVLAFPLDKRGRPDLGEHPRGRFLARYWGYLDPADYTPGRHVTLRGTVSGVRQGRVGDAPYAYARLSVVEVRLWPPASGDGWWPPQLHIGIGVYGGF
ncbi:MAG: Slp family lipoprotein [Pseudomonadota bacterium]